MVAPTIVSIAAIVLAVGLACFCFRRSEYSRPFREGGNPSSRDQRSPSRNGLSAQGDPSSRDQRSPSRNGLAVRGYPPSRNQWSVVRVIAFPYAADLETHSAAMVSLDNKQNMSMEQRDQYYTSVRKPPQSPCRDINALERIPGTVATPFSCN